MRIKTKPKEVEMEIFPNAMLLRVGERRYQGGQYRVPISSLPGKFKKGSYVKTRFYPIANYEEFLVVFEPSNEFDPDAHHITKSGVVTFTPPKDLIPNDAEGRKKKKYKTYQTAELNFG